jgi:hypothetical protein
MDRREALSERAPSWRSGVAKREALSERAPEQAVERGQA